MMASFAFPSDCVQARGTRQGFAPPRKLRAPLTEPARLPGPFPERKAKEGPERISLRNSHADWIISRGQAKQTVA